MLTGGSEVLPDIAEMLMGGSEVLPVIAEMLMDGSEVLPVKEEMLIVGSEVLPVIAEMLISKYKNGRTYERIQYMRFGLWISPLYVLFLDGSNSNPKRVATTENICSSVPPLVYSLLCL